MDTAENDQTQDDKPLSARSVNYRLKMMIEVTALPIFSVAQAQGLVKNLHDDLIRIRASLDHPGGRNSLE